MKSTNKNSLLPFCRFDRKRGQLALTLAFVFVTWTGFSSEAQAQFKLPRLKVPSLPGAKVPDVNTLLPSEEPVSTNIKDVRNELPFLDDYNPQNSRPLSSLKRGPKGGWILKPGMYRGEIRTYCLHAGTYGPTHGNGYLYAPLKGKRSGIIKKILHNSAQKPELEQHEIQSLIWAIEARTDFDRLPADLQKTASALLSEQDILELKGFSVDAVDGQMRDRALDKLSPALRPIYEAQNSLRGLLTQADTPFSQLESVAVLVGDPPKDKDSREIPEGRWCLHPGGFFVRYFPSSYSRTTLQLYVPERFTIRRDAEGRILSVTDTQGNGIETEYKDAVKPRTPPAKHGHGYGFARIRLIGTGLWSVDGKSFRECRNNGWTFIGNPTNGTVEYENEADCPGASARILANAAILRQLEDLRKNFGLSQSAGDNLADALDLANYRLGIEDALRTCGLSAAQMPDILADVWQFALVQWLALLPDDGSLTNPGDIEFDPSDDVATPGDTGRQRLGQSAVVF